MRLIYEVFKLSTIHPKSPSEFYLVDIVLPGPDLFQPSVAFHTESCHLICRANRQIVVNELFKKSGCNFSCFLKYPQKRSAAQRGIIKGCHLQVFWIIPVTKHLKFRGKHDKIFFSKVSCGEPFRFHFPFHFNTYQ